MEPTIYKPSIYNGAGIYKTGDNGGGGIIIENPWKFKNYTPFDKINNEISLFDRGSNISLDNNGNIVIGASTRFGIYDINQFHSKNYTIKYKLDINTSYLNVGAFLRIYNCNRYVVQTNILNTRNSSYNEYYASWSDNDYNGTTNWKSYGYFTALSGEHEIEEIYTENNGVLKVDGNTIVECTYNGSLYSLPWKRWGLDVEGSGSTTIKEFSIEY